MFLILIVIFKLLLYVDNYIMLETLTKFYEWENWEGIMHQLLFLLVIYIIYVFIVNSKERTMINLLLFSIVLDIHLISHQIINIRNQQTTSYL